LGAGPQGKEQFANLPSGAVAGGGGS
jgi:hypothetical protein